MKIFSLIFFLAFSKFQIVTSGRLALEAAQKFENGLEVIATHEQFWKELLAFFTEDFVFIDDSKENFTAFQYIDLLSSRNTSDLFGPIKEAEFDNSANLLVLHNEEGTLYKSNYIQAPEIDLQWKIGKIEVFQGVW
ncbi:unnamed protein product [Caenorhabditis angaria]|uniref:Uncharacterized protein n=1 Tax=Caenorhabditis angaria TaxID=860376 RepID=A0A9P1MXB5_9PELO|nr:unnamed protein product [Caenorhabditis angaria]